MGCRGRMKTAIFYMGLLVMCLSTSLFAGDMSNRFDLTLRRVQGGGPPHYTPDFVLADAVPRHERRFTEFSGDVSGRTIEALAAAAAYTGRSFPELDAILAKLPALQKPDGHFGDPFTTSGAICNNDMALLWGNGRLLVGLMAAYETAPRPEILAVAVKLGDWLLAVAPRLNDDGVQKEFSDKRVAVGYICWTHTVEGLTHLARATSETKYLRMAEVVAARTQRYPSQHSHGFVTSLRGVLDLYTLTGDRRFLDQAEREWQGIIDSGNVFPHGALPEAFKPSDKRDEGCSEADWLRLSLGLWAATRNPRHIDQAELTLFNEFSFNQFSSGDFGHHIMSATGTGAPTARAWWCCTFHGLRAFPVIFRSAFSERDGAIHYDLAVDGAIETSGVALRADSRLEQDATVALEVVRADAREHALAVRIPVWASGVDLRLGDTAMNVTVESGQARVVRRWNAGEKLLLKYDLRTRVTTSSSGMVSFFRGPWLLAADTTASPRFFDEPWDSNRLLVGATPEASLEAAPAGGSIGPFSVPVARCQVRYLPGGYAMQPQKALLRPLAEKTATDDQASWIFAFRTQTEKP